MTNPIIAGAYHAIALDLSRISQEQGQALKARLESTKAKLEAQNFTGLTKDELVGDLLYTTALMYHAELGLTRSIAAKTAKIACATWPSETIFKTDLVVDSIFGLPRSVSAGGLAMDADRLATVSTALDGDQNRKISFLLQSGMMSSALEHSIPEQIFSTPENPAYGISAVKALQLANEQGIPIYTVTKTNLSTVLPQLQLDAQVKSDIQNAVNAGKVVTVSKADINFHGWVGCGYVIVDPQNGSGAYMIGGGLSGDYTIIGAFFASLIDLIAKSHEKFHIGKESVLIKNAGKVGNLLTGAGFILTVKDIVWGDTTTTPLQKIFSILTWLGAITASIAIGGAIVTGLTPILAIPLIIILYIFIAMLAIKLIELFNENINENEFPVIVNKQHIGDNHG